MTHVIQSLNEVQRLTSDLLPTLHRITYYSQVLIGDYKYSSRSNDEIGWLMCDGRTVNRSDYPTLYSVIGTTFGSTNASNFKLPDLRGRVQRLILLLSMRFPAITTVEQLMPLVMLPVHKLLQLLLVLVLVQEMILEAMHILFLHRVVALHITICSQLLSPVIHISLLESLMMRRFNFITAILQHTSNAR